MRNGKSRDASSIAGRLIGCAAAFIAVGTALPAQAQNSKLNWSGTVDGYVRLRIQGNRVPVQTLSGKAPQDVRSDLDGSMPRRNTSVRLERHDGRGTVRIVEQPNSRNDYTCVVDIDDSRYAGSQNYYLRLSWSGRDNGNDGGGNSGGSLSERAYQRGQDDGRNDKRRGMPRNYRRYDDRYDFRTERDYERGYNNGYDYGSGGGNGNGGGDRPPYDSDTRPPRPGTPEAVHFEAGRREGQDDNRRGRSSDWRANWTDYTRSSERDFMRGYRDGLAAGQRDPNSRSRRSNSNRNESAYDAGFRFGFMDHIDNRPEDGKRRYDAWMRPGENPFRQGYDYGYNRDR